MATKDELERENAALKSQLEEMQSQLNARDAALSATGEEGWLITAPNPNYAGFTLGVEFRGGRAFVPNREGGEKVMVQLRDDFGYRVTPMTAKEYRGLAPAAEPKPASNMEKLVQPHIVGGE